MPKNRKLRIIQVNKFFYPKGGADRVFLDTIKLLADAGHEVAVFSMHDERNLPTPYEKYFVSRRDFFNPRGWKQKLAVAGRMLYSFAAKRKFARLVDHFKPDVVHVHNIYHQISPSILSVCRARGIPVVMTAHDWFLINPNYTRYARGKTQTQVSPRWLWRYMFDCGIQNSFAKTVGATVIHRLQYRLGLWLPKITKIIVPSQYLKTEFIRAGIPAEKIVQIPNPVVCPRPSALSPRVSALRRPSEMVFFGRLEREKGVYTILSAAELDEHIFWEIIGDGTELSALKKIVADKKLSNVRLRGRLEGDALQTAIMSGVGVVCPSEWPENQPLSIIEAQLLGVPVIATDIPSIKEMISDGKTGLLIPQKNIGALLKKAQWLVRHPAEAKTIGQAGQEFAREKYDASRYIESLENVYREVIKGRA